MAKYTDHYDDDYYMTFGSQDVRPRFKDGLNLDKLKEGTTFEIDTNESAAYLDEDTAESMSSLLIKSNVRGKVQSLFEKMTLEDVGGNYDELDITMQSIVEDDGVKKLVVKEGFGDLVPKTAKVVVHYICVCEGHDEPYDSTLTKGRPQHIKLSDADVIPGLYLALTSMKHGEVSKFLVSPKYGYGVYGCPPRILPDTRILIIVEILDVLTSLRLDSILQKSSDERALMKFHEILKETEILRSNGNECYTLSNYGGAVRRYRDGIRILEDYPVVNQGHETERNTVLFTFYTNLAQAYLKLDKAPQACVAARMALRFESSSEGKAYKAYFRFAQAKYKLKGFEEAKRLCARAKKLDPSNKSILSLEKKIDVSLQLDEQALTYLYKKMAQCNSPKN